MQIHSKKYLLYLLVQHILASTFLQRCVIWDLRKNEPIIKLTDANSKVAYFLSFIKTNND